MWSKLSPLGLLAVFMSAKAEGTVFEVGLTSFVTSLTSKGDSHVTFLYPTLLEARHPSTQIDLEYLFKDISLSENTLNVKAFLNAPVAPGKYPVIAYMHGGGGGFSLDSHNLLRRWAAQGAIVVTADMPGYEVGDEVWTNQQQVHTARILKELQQDCPPDGRELCAAMDWEHLAATGPGVGDPLCELEGWDRLRPAIQLGLDGIVKSDSDDCEKVDEYDQDAAVFGFGLAEEEADVATAMKTTVEKLASYTKGGIGVSGYMLGFPEIPASLAFTDLCSISHSFRGLKRVRGSAVKQCGNFEDGIQDAHDIISSITTNLLFHHLWKGTPLESPADQFEPEEYPNYLFRAVEDGAIVDAVGRPGHGSTDGHSDQTPVVPLDSDTPPEPNARYPFRTPTLFVIMPLVLIMGLYFFCGVGLCVTDYRQAKRRSKAEPPQGFFNKLKRLFRRDGGPRGASFKPLSEDGSLEDGHIRRHHRRHPIRRESTGDTDDSRSTVDSEAETGSRSSTLDFLTGKQRRESDDSTPHSSGGAVELQERRPTNGSIASSTTRPLLSPEKPKRSKKKSSGYRPPNPAPSKRPPQRGLR